MLSSRQCHCVRKCNTIGLTSFCIAPLSVLEVKVAERAAVSIVKIAKQRVKLQYSVIYKCNHDINSKNVCPTGNVYVLSLSFLLPSCSHCDSASASQGSDEEPEESKPKQGRIKRRMVSDSDSNQSGSEGGHASQSPVHQEEAEDEEREGQGGGGGGSGSEIEGGQASNQGSDSEDSD